MNEMNWDDLKLFLAVARSGGLSAAARLTGKSAPTLGRRMLALENTTGQDLFHRQARGYILTEHGQTLLEKLTELEAQILPLDRSGDGATKPLVKVSAGQWVTHYLCQQTQALLQNNDIRLRFISADHVLDITHREAVVAIRNHRPDDPNVATRKLGPVHFAGYATNPKQTAWIKVVGNTPSARWLAAQPNTEAAAEVTSPRNALDLAHAGLGRVVLPTFIGNSDPNLQQITPVITDLDHDQWLVAHQDERFTPGVRRLIDRLYEVMEKLPR
jgi:DNA-binding transcriptional LysR family regulator